MTGPAPDGRQRFNLWDSDHTALVHVLWCCTFDGLTLKDDFDAVASRILQSDWYAATLAHADWKREQRWIEQQK